MFMLRNCRALFVRGIIATFAASTLASASSANAQTDLYIPPIRELIIDADNPLVIDKDRRNVANMFYIDEISRKIEQAIFSWPRDASGRRIHGEVSVTLILNSDGSVSDLIFRPSPGYQQDPLAELATKIIYSVSPFSKPPSNVIREHKRVQFARHFKFWVGK